MTTPSPHGIRRTAIASSRRLEGTSAADVGAGDLLVLSEGIRCREATSSRQLALMMSQA